MMETVATEKLTLARDVISALWKPARATLRRIHIWIFRLRTRKQPLEEAEAKQIAYSVLAGDVMRAVSYRNIDSHHIFIACARRSSERDSDLSVYVLEQIGETYKVVWKSERIGFADPMALEVRDLDGDGHREVIFEDHSYGTGGGSRSLTVHSTKTARLFTVTESLNWQNLAGPPSPEVEITPADASEMNTILEKVARKRGFLRATRPVDFDDPEFAVRRWHKENGIRATGAIKLHFYQGYPHYQSTLVASLDTGTTLWLAHFKGPLFGYEKFEDRHFIAYSPACFYNWPTCLAFDGENLWFGVHCKNGVMSFRPADSLLVSYESVEGIALPEVEELEIDEDTLALNRALRIPLSSLAVKSLQGKRSPIN